MATSSAASALPHCPYCGQPTRHGGACPEHADLAHVDPYELAKGEPLPEAELIATWRELGDEPHDELGLG